MDLPRGTICSEADYARELKDRSVYCLLRGETIGVVVKSLLAAHLVP
jgi:hypothetical protein